MPDRLLWIALTIRMTPIIFGFSWGVPIWLRNPSFWGLEKLGFPWIPSSESGLINGLRGIFREKFFVTPGSPEKPERAPVRAIRKGGIVHGASLVQFLLVSNHLSLPPSSLFILALAISIIAFPSGRMDRLRDVVHLVLFTAHMQLIFQAHLRRETWLQRYISVRCFTARPMTPCTLGLLPTISTRERKVPSPIFFANFPNISSA